MKRTQLNKIIREEIKRLQTLKEQPNPITPSDPYNMLSSFAAWSQLNPGVPIDWRCLPTIRTWLTQTIFTLPPFNSGAANQPCQFICNKICQIEAWIAGFSGNPNSPQLAQKQCKLDIFTAMLPWAQDEWNQPGSMNGC